MTLVFNFVKKKYEFWENSFFFLSNGLLLINPNLLIQQVKNSIVYFKNKTLFVIHFSI